MTDERDPRDDAAKLIPVIEKLNALQLQFDVAVIHLDKIIKSYDQFLDAETVQPLVDAVLQARLWLTSSKKYTSKRL